MLIKLFCSVYKRLTLVYTYNKTNWTFFILNIPYNWCVLFYWYGIFRKMFCFTIRLEIPVWDLSSDSKALVLSTHSSSYSKSFVDKNHGDPAVLLRHVADSPNNFVYQCLVACKTYTNRRFSASQPPRGPQ